MSDDLEGLRRELLAAVSAASDVAGLEQVRVEILGRKGRITELTKGLGALSPDARRERGQALNRLKDEAAAAIEARKADLGRADLERRLAAERIDVTLPAWPEAGGRIHPISQTLHTLGAGFGATGFSLPEAPDSRQP